MTSHRMGYSPRKQLKFITARQNLNLPLKTVQEFRLLNQKLDSDPEYAQNIVSSKIIVLNFYNLQTHL